MISDAVIINHTNHSLAVLCAKYSSTHGWAPRQMSVCQGSCPALSCLSLRLCTLMLLFAYYYWKATGIIILPLITWALHGCMIYITLHGGSFLMSRALNCWLWGLELAEGNLLSEWYAVYPGRILCGCACTWGSAWKCVCVNGCMWIAKGVKGRYYTVCGCVLKYNNNFQPKIQIWRFWFVTHLVG